MITSRRSARTELPAAPQVPGLLVGPLVAPSVPGRPAAWWAVDEDGRDVVVQRVRPAGGTGPLAGLDEASLRRRLAHPHVVPLLRVVRCREGAVQVLGPAPGGALPDLLAGRSRLDPGEVAVLVAGLGSALGALHEADLVHGEVCASGVLVDRAGLPLLLGWGGARSAVPEGVRRRELRAGGGPRPRRAGPHPAEDVRALARLGLAALGEDVGGGAEDSRAGDAGGGDPSTGDRAVLAALLRAALAAEGPAAPSAQDLARACWEAVPPVPLGAGLPDAASSATAVTQRVRRSAARGAGPAPEHQRRGPRLGVRLARHPGRWAAGLLAVALLAGAAVAIGAARPVDARLTSEDPAVAVPALAELRLRAVAEQDASLLDRVDVAGSAAARADAALVAALGGRRVEGAAARVVSASVEEREGHRAWVRVVSAVSAHRVVAGGSVVEVPDSGPVTSRLLLQREDGTWKVVRAA
ncbi:protein kinase [Quadrisphaera sp. KR29]|uniref:protein kinase n=1 Tax=Quadrisphaera sp. KR29 TaxID=3461391 RepID=UPI00404439D6